MNTLSYSTSARESLEKDFQTSLKKGIPQREVQERREKSGYNILKSRTLVWPMLLKRQFTSPFVYLLAACTVASFFLESKINAIIILFILFVNGLVSFYQEYKSYKILQLLQKQIERVCMVVRDGTAQRIPYTHLIPGDIVLLDADNYVPADVRLLEGQIVVDISAGKRTDGGRPLIDPGGMNPFQEMRDNHSTSPLATPSQPLGPGIEASGKGLTKRSPYLLTRLIAPGGCLTIAGGRTAWADFISTSSRRAAFFITN